MVVSYVASGSGLELTNLIRASLLINDPDATIPVRLHDDLAHFLRTHSAASHVRQEASFFIRELGHHLQIIFDARFQESREAAPPVEPRLIRVGAKAGFGHFDSVWASRLPTHERAKVHRSYMGDPLSSENKTGSRGEMQIGLRPVFRGTSSPFPESESGDGRNYGAADIS